MITRKQKWYSTHSVLFSPRMRWSTYSWTIFTCSVIRNSPDKFACKTPTPVSHPQCILLLGLELILGSLEPSASRRIKYWLSSFPKTCLTLQNIFCRESLERWFFAAHYFVSFTSLYILLIIFLNSLVSAVLEMGVEGSSGTEVTHLEKCACPTGYEGLSCESCDFGYTRIIPDSSSPRQHPVCTKCNCFGHAATCDPVTGACGVCILF